MTATSAQQPAGGAGEQHARLTEHDGILTVTIDRPKLNLISAQVTSTLWQAANLLSDRDDLRCLVITGVGRYFTAGVDLSEPVGNRQGNPETEHLHPGWNMRRNYRSHHALYDEFEAIEKPIIIAAQGICLGGGVEMAVSCDFRFCTPQAEFAVPEIHIGVLAGSGGTSRLTRIVGPAWGKWMAMAGRKVTAEQALRIGLVHDIFPTETFLEDVYAFCRELTTIPAEALGVAKLAVDMYADISDRTAQRHLDRLLVTNLLNTPEFKERSARLGFGGAKKPQS
ncbi:Enoyl-CoA hydratase/carnithine racemase [Parafrankia irregularis]|uniref:Enoyl-CoA hydratase/carnithine racemase n=1 Tax=Parafrankia irregularis TaxID=795642 RepID=A0A0S4QHH1_9ACTN|nr:MULTISPECIES: enoyl-CoA hydratase/isomerase family protein [Parafrankia]MBE3200747.1 enoyl-CoA hydratase/isomerase family protein [Parafrankia sp. CH37]CUU54867.1 Enoyl-CoA hydratase/carnithine racemase [Parafrankia irregularis]